jgi:hypothetical protein
MTGRALAIGAGYVDTSEFVFGMPHEFGKQVRIDEVSAIGRCADTAVHREFAEKIVQRLLIVHHRGAKINKTGA